MDVSELARQAERRYREAQQAKKHAETHGSPEGYRQAVKRADRAWESMVAAQNDEDMWRS